MPDTQTGISRGGWAGAVMWRAGAVGSAVHNSISHVGRSSDAKTARQVPKTPKKQRRDRQTDRQTDQRTDTVTYQKKVEVCLQPFFAF